MNKLKNSLATPLKNVSINDSFWSRYASLVRDVVIPYQWNALNDKIPDAEPSHAITNFRIAAGEEQGEFYGMVFQDSDVAKWLEAVGYSLETHPDAELERTADEVIDIIEKAQQPDGYLNTYYTLKEPGKRWTNLRECHELYCAGHMMEAAVAYYKATGKRKLLDVMCRFADNIDSMFGPEPDKLKGYPGHQEIELALVKLYRVTGNEKYLKLSKYFIDERGKQPYYFVLEWEKRGKTSHWPMFDRFGNVYNQTHLPVRQQTTAEGHSVRAVYMYAGMADIAAETGDMELYEACRRLWDNIVSRRMYITGGIGSASHGEAFTFDYDLPNDTVYAETCASIGLVFFAHRMLQIEAKGYYADVMERALYNTVISGISMDGKRFFYVNPLEVWPEASEKNPVKRHVRVTRQKWFGCACCPPNVARMLTSLGEYIYTANEKAVYVNLYIGGEAQVELEGDKIKLTQETQYPWDEKVSIKISAQSAKEFSLALRIPGWCGNAKILVNGKEINAKAVLKDGYAVIDRIWSDGDHIELTMEMPVLRMKANPSVRADIGRVALQRGPVVYCLEEEDNGADLHEVILPEESGLKVEFDSELLGGISIITADAKRIKHVEWENELYKADTSLQVIPARIKFIPYYAWANRKPGEMTVWVRES